MDIIVNGELAKKYGVNSAIFIRHLYYWISKNACNGKHYYDGRYWSYNSMESFAKSLDFWTESQIRHIIEKLKKEGVLLVGNFNDHKYDRTAWYSLSDEIFEFYGEKPASTPEKSDLSNLANASDKNSKCICQNRQMEVTKLANAFDKISRPIPNKIPNIIPNNNPPISPHEKNDDWEKAWEAFIEMRKKLKSPLTDRAKQMLIHKLDGLTSNKKEQIAILNQSTINAWKSVYPLHDERGSPNKQDTWEGVTRL